MEQGSGVKMPSRPSLHAVVTPGRVAKIAVGVFFIIAAFLMVATIEQVNIFSFPFLLVFIFGAVVICGPVVQMKEDSDENNALYAQYLGKVNRAKAAAQADQKAREKIPALNNEIRRWRGELTKINNLLNAAYAVNIIPGPYRNLYAVVYLYDYFSKSQEDNLALALNTFVLEEIKAKLDQMIHMMSDSLINQELILSNQYKSMEQQERHQQELNQRLDRLQLSEDEANQSREMIAVHTATLAYFAEADYFRNL